MFGGFKGKPKGKPPIWRAPPKKDGHTQIELGKRKTWGALLHVASLSNGESVARTPEQTEARLGYNLILVLAPTPPPRSVYVCLRVDCVWIACCFFPFETPFWETRVLGSANKIDLLEGSAPDRRHPVACLNHPDMKQRANSRLLRSRNAKMPGDLGSSFKVVVVLSPPKKGGTLEKKTRQLLRFRGRSGL